MTTASPADSSDLPNSASGDTSARTSRGSLAAGLVLGVAGAGLVLLAAGRTWAEGRAAVQGGQRAAVAVTVTGHDITAVPGALALVGLASLVAVFAVRRAGRVAVSALLALSGAGIVVAVIAGVAGRTALDEAAAAATGLSEAAATGVTHTAWPWVTVFGGVLLLGAGVVALVRGRDWPAMSGRYDAPGVSRPGRAPAASQRPDDMWNALDRGEDPTQR